MTIVQELSQGATQACRTGFVCVLSKNDSTKHTGLGVAARQDLQRARWKRHNGERASIPLVLAAHQGMLFFQSARWTRGRHLQRTNPVAQTAEGVLAVFLALLVPSTPPPSPRSQRLSRLFRSESNGRCSSQIKVSLNAQAARNYDECSSFPQSTFIRCESLPKSHPNSFIDYL